MSSDKSPEQEVSGGINVQRANDVALRAEDDIVGRDKVTITHNYFNDPKSQDPAVEGQVAKAPATDLPAVVPQGLQSFGEDAKGFFLRLLPPPYHQDGLPESLHFWKRQIEQTDADETFRVGVIYGKSGCGKSSWVKAGLLPRLEGVTSVYVEAIPDGTPQRLLAKLRIRCPWLGGDAASLAEVLQRKDRIPSTTKVLLVLDQFEQWLHGRTEENYGELLDALQACDGARVQCLLLIRSDFWDLLTRFLHRLSVRQEEGRNLAMFDLFDKRHARHVLTMFGEAYGALPKSGERTPEQETFLNKAIEGLAEGGRIVCVRLSLFAAMLKGRDWTPVTLDQIGGAKGVGFAFLEEKFSSHESPRQYRRHETAARAVLEQLLPAVGTDIKGGMRSEVELRSRSGYERRPEDFAELLQILNQELRLITPTAPVETTVDQAPPPEDASGEAPVGPKYYQLTHDYLVPSLRDWLTDGQKSTWRGRAFLLLAERTAEWTSKKRQVRSLPGPLEYLRIMAAAVLPTRRLRLPSQRLTPPQRRLMWAATRWYGMTASLLLVFAAVLGWWRWDRNRGDQAWSLANELNLKTNLLAEYRTLVSEQLPRYRRWIVPELHLRVQQKPKDDFNDAQRVDAGERRADEAIALLRLDALDEACDAFKWQAHGDPEVLTQFVHRAKERGVTVEQLARLYELATKSQDDTTRFAVTLTLGTFDETELDVARRKQLAEQLKLTEVYSTDPSSGIHGATGWLLGEWQIPKPAIEPREPSKDGPDWIVIQPLKDAKDALTFVRLPKGEFVRRDDDYPKAADQTVTLTRDVWLSDREVTVKLFRRFVDDLARPDSSYRQKYSGEISDGWKWPGEHKSVSPNDSHPVQQVNWEDAVMFCNWLSRQEGREKVCYRRKSTNWELVPEADGYRLPTEAEWEYACRAVTATTFGFGSDERLLKRHAWYNANSDRQTHPVATKMPNTWGLYDMHGNVEEWCQNWFSDKRSIRAFRGGSWGDSAGGCRSAFRNWYDPSDRFHFLGFRVALSPSGPESSPRAAQPPSP